MDNVNFMINARNQTSDELKKRINKLDLTES